MIIYPRGITCGRCRVGPNGQGMFIILTEIHSLGMARLAGRVITMSTGWRNLEQGRQVDIEGWRTVTKKTATTEISKPKPECMCACTKSKK